MDNKMETCRDVPTIVTITVMCHNEMNTNVNFNMCIYIIITTI